MMTEREREREIEREREGERGGERGGRGEGVREKIRERERNIKVRDRYPFQLPLLYWVSRTNYCLYLFIEAYWHQGRTLFGPQITNQAHRQIRH